MIRCPDGKWLTTALSIAWRAPSSGADGTITSTIIITRTATWHSTSVAHIRIYLYRFCVRAPILYMLTPPPLGPLLRLELTLR